MDLDELASHSVVRLEVERQVRGGLPANKEVARGSAVVMTAQPANAPQTLTIATAYHVIHRALVVRVYMNGRSQEVATIGDHAEVFVDRSRELVFLRVNLKPGQGQELRAIDLNKVARGGDANGLPGQKVSGRAFGYSRRRSLSLDSSRVDFLGVVPAQTLKIAKPDSFPLGDGEQYPEQMPFQMLGDQATVEGMSGGLAVHQDGKFGGLIYGRRTDQFNLIIPAEQVLDVWQRANTKQPWPKFDTKLFEKPSAFFGVPDELDAPIENRLDWGTMEGLSVLLGDDPLHAIERFQEIVVTPPARGRDPRELEIYVMPTETLPNTSHSIKFWLNGVEVKRDPIWSKVVLPFGQLPGETMLTVVKRSSPVNDFELGKFLLPSKVDLTFQYRGERPFLRVVRSLPVIAQEFPLFVTIVNDPDVPLPAHLNKTPANARLAIRLDYAQAVLNQAPFTLKVHDKREQYEYDGLFRLHPHSAWTLKRVSSQRLGVTLDGEVDIQKLRYQTLDLTPQRRAGEGPPRFSVSGRFQFPFLMPGPDAQDPKWGTYGLAVSARATAAKGTGSLRVKLRNDLDFDLAGILRHLFTVFVNGRLIGDDKPHRIADDKFLEFLRPLGISTPPGWKGEFRQAVIELDPDGKKEWLVFTFRFDSLNGGGGEAPANRVIRVPPSAIQHPKRVIDIEAWGVPGSVLDQLAGLDAKNPITSAALKSIRADHLALSVDVAEDPNEWFKGLKKSEEVFFFKDDARGVARRISEALAESLKTADCVRLQASVSPTTLRDILQIVLQRPDLKLETGKTGTLQIDARRGRSGSSVSVKLENGKLELSSPGDARIDIGDGNHATGIKLSVGRLEAQGDFGSDQIKGILEANMSIRKLEAAGSTFENGTGRITLLIDNAPGAQGLGTAEVEAAKVIWRLSGSSVNLHLNGKIPVNMTRDLKFQFDPRLLRGASPR